MDGRRRRAAGCTGILSLALAPLVAAALAHLLLDDAHVVTATVHGGIGWWLVPAGPLALLALAARRLRLAAIGGGVAALHLARVVPGNLPGAEAGEADLRIGTANVLWTHPDPPALLDELDRLDADVWVLQEVDPAWTPSLDAPAAVARWPHRHLAPEPGSFGFAILSKLPIDRAWSEDVAGVGVGFAEVGGLTVMAVHAEPPRTVELTTRWRTQLAAIADRAAQLPRPLVVAGDFNATRHHPSFARLLRTTGLRDAHDEVGRAAATTWPAPPYGGCCLPSLRLDHVLLSEGLHAVSAAEGDGRGSDHRPVVVGLRRQLGPTWGGHALMPPLSGTRG